MRHGVEESVDVFQFFADVLEGCLLLGQKRSDRREMVLDELFQGGRSDASGKMA